MQIAAPNTFTAEDPEGGTEAYTLEGDDAPCEDTSISVRNRWLRC